MYFLVHRNKWILGNVVDLKHTEIKFKSRCAGWGKEPFPAVLVIDETEEWCMGCVKCLRFSGREEDIVQILKSPLHWLPSPNNDQRSRHSPMWSESVPTGFGLCHLRGTLCHGKTGMPGTSACPGLKNTASFSINCLCASDQPWAQTLWAMSHKALKKTMLALRTGRRALLGWRTAGR